MKKQKLIVRELNATLLLTFDHARYKKCVSIFLIYEPGIILYYVRIRDASDNVIWLYGLNCIYLWTCENSRKKEKIPDKFVHGMCERVLLVNATLGYLIARKILIRLICTDKKYLINNKLFSPPSGIVQRSWNPQKIGCSVCNKTRIRPHIRQVMYIS